MTIWTSADDSLLREAYLRGDTVLKISNDMGRSDGSIRNRAYRLQITADRTWPDDVVSALCDLYRVAGENGILNLKAFSEKHGLSPSNISRKAKELGFKTSLNRKVVEARKVKPRKYATIEEGRRACGDATKARFANGGHPRGMAGKKHTAETKDIIAAKSAAMWSEMTDEKRADMTMKALKSRHASMGHLAPQYKRGTWKAEWAEIGGVRKFYRSRWELNYAHYLEWLRLNGSIASWAHEPETFWFEKIKRGVRSYLPDFIVTENDGSVAYHEVKGWMDARSKTTIARFGRYYPQHKLIVISEKQYKAIGRKVSGLVDGWRD